MATNDFIGFASSGAANVMSQADYAAAHEQFVGVQPGMASSAMANKVWRQGANMAAAIGELIKNHGNDALDNGDLVTLYNALLLSTASTTLAGLMSATDKTKLDGLISTDATQSAAGYMSAADKTKLDGILSTLNFDPSITAGEYYKIKIGTIIILVGRASSAASAISPLVFPEAFPTGCFTVFATPMYWDTPDVISMNTGNFTKTGCNVWCVFHYLSGSQNFEAREYSWIAIGR